MKTHLFTWAATPCRTPPSSLQKTSTPIPNSRSGADPISWVLLRPRTLKHKIQSRVRLRKNGNTRKICRSTSFAPQSQMLHKIEWRSKKKNLSLRLPSIIIKLPLGRPRTIPNLPLPSARRSAQFKKSLRRSVYGANSTMECQTKMAISSATPWRMRRRKSASAKSRWMTTFSSCGSERSTGSTSNNTGTTRLVR